MGNVGTEARPLQQFFHSDRLLMMGRSAMLTDSNQGSQRAISQRAIGK